MGKFFKALPILLLVMTFTAIPPACAGQSQDEKVAAGELVSVDMEHQTLTIKNASDEELQFQYNADTKVEGSQNGIQGLSTRTGTRVNVHYKLQEDLKVATKIEILKDHREGR